MTGLPEPRPVWLTREQRDRYAAYLSEQSLYTSFAQQELDALVAAWDAAPADATSLIAEAYLELTPDEAREQAMALLRALGMPLGGGDAD